MSRSSLPTTDKHACLPHTQGPHPCRRKSTLLTNRPCPCPTNHAAIPSHPQIPHRRGSSCCSPRKYWTHLSPRPTYCIRIHHSHASHLSRQRGLLACRSSQCTHPTRQSHHVCIIHNFLEREAIRDAVHENVGLTFLCTLADQHRRNPSHVLPSVEAHRGLPSHHRHHSMSA